jgi:hypothetical protein
MTVATEKLSPQSDFATEPQRHRGLFSEKLELSVPVTLWQERSVDSVPLWQRH